MKIIDLSHKIYTGMPSIASDKHVKTEIKEISNVNKDSIERHQILMSCHSGTHIDVPRHLIKDGITLDKIPLNNFIGKVKKIIINKNKDEIITLKDIQDKDINNIDFLIIQTNWEKKWNSNYYFNHPYFSEEAINYLIKIKLKGLLIDLPNPDKFDSKDYPIHKLLFKSNLILVENVCNLDKLENDVYDIIIAPLNLVDVEAAPVRVFIFSKP